MVSEEQIAAGAKELLMVMSDFPERYPERAGAHSEGAKRIYLAMSSKAGGDARRGYDIAVAAVRSWVGHGLPVITDEQLEAVAHDLEMTKDAALDSLTMESGDGR